MQISQSGLDLIKEFEGFRSYIYDDATGLPWNQSKKGTATIGYGTTKADVDPLPTHMTPDEALRLLKRRIDSKYAPSINALSLPLNQHQFDALVSFVYNVGPGGVSDGTKVGIALRHKRWTAAANAMLEWNKYLGQVNKGLVRRREAEHALFMQADRTFEGYTDSEVRWIREYDKLVREKGDGERIQILRSVMTEQRKRIWHSAQTSGWDKAHRKARYRSLLARTS